METVTLTLRETGWSFGDDDALAGNSGTFSLPDGYILFMPKCDPGNDADNWGNLVAIYDPYNYPCEILVHASGKPQLRSLAGPVTDMPVLEAA